MQLSHRILAFVENALSLAAAVIMFAIMAIVSSDVAMRYLFNRPFFWAYDLISLYLMTGLFYFALSRTYVVHAHIGVDILQYHISPGMRRLCEIVDCVLAATLFATIAAVGADRTLESFAQHDIVAGSVPWPTWASFALVPLGASLITLRLLLNAASHLVSLMGGPEFVELAPLSGAESSAGFE